MENKKELLYDGVYYDVTHWVKRHPGGGKIIEMFTSEGEDSTIAVQQFHQRSTKKVMSVMKSLPQRKPSENDINGNKIDAVKQKKHDALTEDYLKLYETFQSEGLFKPDHLHVFFRLTEIIFLICLAFYILTAYPHNLFLRTAGILCGFLGFGRSGWVMHEASHHSLFGIPKLDRLMRSLIYGFVLGLSGSYWTSQHSRHHAMPQHIQHDVDIKTLPIIAFHTKVVKNPKDGKTFFIRNQQWLFILVDTVLIAIVWKLWIHPRTSIHKGRYEELVFMALHVIVSLNVGLTNYFIVFWLTSVYLLGNIMLSHSHLDVAEEPTHWVEYALTHTANVRSSWWVDYWMGNLNYQIEHHLFPTMPQYRNKLCRDKIKALAKKHNLPYNLYSYSEAVKKCFDNLGAVSKELAMN